MAKLPELVSSHQRQQPLLKGGGKLQGQAQVAMPGGERHDLGPHVSFDAELAKQLQV
jgi:hypothetical protein